MIPIPLYMSTNTSYLYLEDEVIRSYENMKTAYLITRRQNPEEHNQHVEIRLQGPQLCYRTQIIFVKMLKKIVPTRC